MSYFLIVNNAQTQIVAKRNLGAINNQKRNIEMRKKAEQYNLGETKVPNDSVHLSATGGGYYLEFERGVVYFNPKLKQAFAIWGKIFEKYAAQSWEHGFLGYPTSDYSNTPKRTGSYQHFDNGSIYYSKTSGAHFMKGWFKDHWANLGWENSPLGFPTTDELGCNKDGYTIYQNFEYGSLFVGENKKIVQSKNKKATEPTADEILAANPPPPPAPVATFKRRPKTNYILSFNANGITGSEASSFPIVSDDPIDLYGWMDIRVYKADGAELTDINKKPYTLFNIGAKEYLESCRGFDFNENNLKFNRNYNLTKADIEEGAYIRFIYWIMEYDSGSGDDYLPLKVKTGSLQYNGGNHSYREIKISDIYKSENYTMYERDMCDDNSDYIGFNYILKLTNK